MSQTDSLLENARAKIAVRVPPGAERTVAGEAYSLRIARR